MGRDRFSFYPEKGESACPWEKDDRQSAEKDSGVRNNKKKISSNRKSIKEKVKDVVLKRKITRPDVNAWTGGEVESRKGGSGKGSL